MKSNKGNQKSNINSVSGKKNTTSISEHQLLEKYKKIPSRSGIEPLNHHSKRYKKRPDTDIFFVSTEKNTSSVKAPHLETEIVPPRILKGNQIEKNQRSSSPLIKAFHRRHKSVDNDHYQSKEKSMNRSMELISPVTKTKAKDYIRVKPKSVWANEISTEKPKYLHNSNSRENNLRMHSSNIFFRKEKSLKKLLNNSTEINHSTEKDPNKYMKWSGKVDWKSTNTELMFLDNAKERKIDRSLSPYERRLKENQSHFPTEHHLKTNYSSTLECKKKLSEENDVINDKELKQLCFMNAKNTAAAIKQYNNVSSAQKASDYNSNMKQKNDKNHNETHALYSIDNISKFQEMDIEKDFKVKGLHVYEVKKIIPITGDKTSLQFKIRTDIDDKTFNGKMNNINDSVKKMNGSGMKIINANEKNNTKTCNSNRKEIQTINPITISNQDVMLKNDNNNKKLFSTIYNYSAHFDNDGIPLPIRNVGVQESSSYRKTNSFKSRK